MPQIKPVSVKAGKIQNFINLILENRPLALVKIVGGSIIRLFNSPIVFAELYKAFPANITVGVNEPVTFRVGNVNETTGEIDAKKMPFFLNDRILYFSAEVLAGDPSGVWFINFDPPSVSQSVTNILATNVTISLTSPPKASEHIQNTIVRIHIADTWIVGNLWTATKSDLDIFTKLTWPIAALTAGFGKLSGKILVDPYYVDVLVTVKPFHAAKIQALPPSKLTPNEIVSIPVLVENQGNYNDTFNFKIRTESGYPLTITNNGTITLQPGEQGQAFVGVAAPANFLDTGTLHSIFIDTYSAEDNTTSIASQRIFVETQGLYFSEENSAYTIGVGLLFLIGFILFLNWRRKIPGKISKKPEKPWKIPEERTHLAELKRTDNNTYEQERIMMQDEYKSALLWYKDDKRQSKGKPAKETQGKPKPSIFNKVVTALLSETKPQKKQKGKAKKKPIALLEKPKEKKVEPIVSSQDTTKEKILSRIRREQEKQLRKLP